MPKRQSSLGECRIAFLGGGSMADALLSGLFAADAIAVASVRASDVVPERRAYLRARHGIETEAESSALAAWADVIVLAVKPAVALELSATLSGSVREHTLVVSVAAGVSTGAIEDRLGGQARVVRAMPNAPAGVRAAATAIAAGRHATKTDLALARTLFEAVGICVTVPEQALDAVTGLSGSGPAYVMLFIEALADGGVRAGLPRDVAQTLAAQTVYGSAKMMIDSGEHPARLKDRVTSPGGTTVAGLSRLESAGVRGAVIDAVEAASRRATELGG